MSSTVHMTQIHDMHDEEKSSILCKYYLHGVCNRGESCPFSHDIKAIPNHVCTYWLAGHCSYGDRCRYDHKRPTWAPKPEEAKVYEAPAAVKKPETDDISTLRPISKLRLGRSLAGNVGNAELMTDTISEPSNASVNSNKRTCLITDQNHGPICSDYRLRESIPDLPDDLGIGCADTAEETLTGISPEMQKLITEMKSLAHVRNSSENESGQAFEEFGSSESVYTGNFYGNTHGNSQPGSLSGCSGSNGCIELYQGDIATHSYFHQGAYSEAGCASSNEDYGDNISFGENHVSVSSGGHAAWHIPAGTSWDSGFAGSLERDKMSKLFTSSLSSMCYEFSRHGTCSNMAACKMVHGDWCETCQRYVLHPTDSSLRESHQSECKARHMRLAALQRSVNVECGICYERVLEKTNPADRKFGLLSCDHAFCLGCIRSWRQNTLGEADVQSAVRTCPVCRETAHYITPSTVWPTSAEEKEAILSGYRAKLNSIDCKHFNFGEGTCPFGTSCMYRHMYPDGRLEEKGIRKVAVDEGEVKVVQPVRLSDFIEIKRGRVRGRRG